MFLHWKPSPLAPPRGETERTHYLFRSELSRVTSDDNFVLGTYIITFNKNNQSSNVSVIIYNYSRDLYGQMYNKYSISY